MVGRHFRSVMIAFALAAFVAATLAVTLRAEDAYLGAWKIASATVAPWADPAARKPDPTEMNALVGKTVTFKAREIVGPRTFACKGPHYKLTRSTADMLFQGAFGEMHDKDKSVDPATLAASVGFQGKEWKVLETGCETEVDWHFVDPATIAIGLNDYVYVLKKQ